MNETNEKIQNQLGKELLLIISTPYSHSIIY